MANDFGLSKSELAQIDAMAAAAAKPNINLMAGMISGDPTTANMSSQLQAQGARAGAQRVSGLQSALQARAQSRDVGTRQTTLQASRVKASQDAAILARQQSQADYTRDRADKVTDLEFKRQQAMDLAELRNLRTMAASDKEKARYARQERRFRMAHHKTQQPKSLSNSEATTLKEGSSMINVMADSLSTFQDSFVTPEAGIRGRMENLASQEFGMFTGPETDKQAAWWEQYKRFIELVERHEFFGATLTKGENQSWKQAEINIGMKPAKLRANLEKRMTRFREVLAEYATGITISKKNPNSVKALVQRGLGDDFHVEKELYIEPFPEDILTGGETAEEKAIDDMSMEEMQEEVNRLKELEGG